MYLARAYPNLELHIHSQTSQTEPLETVWQRYDIKPHSNYHEHMLIAVYYYFVKFYSNFQMFTVTT